MYIWDEEKNEAREATEAEIPLLIDYVVSEMPPPVTAMNEDGSYSHTFSLD